MQGFEYLKSGVLRDDNPCLRQFSKHLLAAWEVEIIPTVRRRLGDQAGAVCQQSSERHTINIAADSAR